MFSKNIRALYLYAVCFITLMMTLGGIIFTVNAIADHFLASNYYNDNYSVRQILNSIAVWAISMPIFIFHWKATKKEGEGA